MLEVLGLRIFSTLLIFLSPGRFFLVLMQHKWELRILDTPPSFIPFSRLVFKIFQCHTCPFLFLKRGNQQMEQCGLSLCEALDPAPISGIFLGVTIFIILCFALYPPEKYCKLEYLKHVIFHMILQLKHLLPNT